MATLRLTARWLYLRESRVQHEDVLTRIAGQTLVHPIRHGARVVLPPEEAGQGRLF